MSKSNGKNIGMAGMVGAVIGAGLAVAAEKVLSDKKTKAKVDEVIGKVKMQVRDTIQMAEENMDKMSTNAKPVSKQATQKSGK